jgi:hypothetical protein
MAIKGIITVVIPLNPVFDIPMQSPHRIRAAICQGSEVPAGVRPSRVVTKMFL